MGNKANIIRTERPIQNLDQQQQASNPSSLSVSTENKPNKPQESKSTTITYIVNAYVRQRFLEWNEEHQYPDVLTVLIVQYVGTIWISFDTVHPNHQQYIQAGGRYLKIGRRTCSSFNIGCSLPFQSGIYTIIIECLSDGNNIIGITSDTTDCKKESHWIFQNEKVYTYVIYPPNLTQTHVCSEYTRETAWSQNMNGKQGSVCKDFKKNDQIKLIVNCNYWRLTYFINDEQVGNHVRIARDIMYYLVMCIQHWNTEYRIIFFEHQP